MTRKSDLLKLLEQKMLVNVSENKFNNAIYFLFVLQAAAVFCLAVASASAGHLGLAHVGYYAPNPAAHIPSGSVGVGPNGAVVAGPAGSIKTNNGLDGHGAGAVVAGPAGQISTHGGHVVLTGPGNGYDDGYAGHGAVYAAAPVAYAAAPVAYHAAPAIAGVGAWGPAAGLIGGWGHGGLVGGPGYGHGYYGHGW